MLRCLRECDLLYQIPVIALTTSTSSHDREAIEALGVDYYVVKSFNLDLYMKIGQLIKEVLTAQEQTRGTQA